MAEGSDDIWSGDLLERRDAAELLYTFIVNRLSERASAGKRGSYVMNIDAEWGQGKSFFIERLYQAVLLKGHPAVFVNAWRDDFSDDPFTAVLSEFSAYIEEFETRDTGVKDRLLKKLDVVKRNAGKFMWIATKGLAGRLIEKALGDGKDEIVELLSDVAPVSADTAAEIISKPLADVITAAVDKYATRKIDEFSAAKKSIINFEQSFCEIVEALRQDGKAMPFFIFVDELDRCRPTYAISMLERIKHLFDVENVVFLIATDTDQLAHSINAVYGQGFDSRKYLNRFFNRPYLLPAPDRYNLVRAGLEQYGLDHNRLALPFNMDDHAHVISEIADHYDLDTRQLEHCIDVLASIVTTWSRKAPLHLTIIFVLIIGFLQKYPLSNHDKIVQLLNVFNKEQRRLGFKTQRNGNGTVVDVAGWNIELMNRVRGGNLHTVATTMANEVAGTQNPIIANVLNTIVDEVHLTGRNYPSAINSYLETIGSVQRFTDESKF